MILRIINGVFKLKSEAFFIITLYHENLRSVFKFKACLYIPFLHVYGIYERLEYIKRIFFFF